MSKEIYEELDKILQKSKPDAFMGLNRDELKTIEQKSKDLSSNERAKLLINFDTAAGAVLYDPGRFLQAQIRIEDNGSRASEVRPLAYIKFTDGSQSYVEIIDILESVRSDAMLIVHPVIIYAVNYWQEI